MKKVVMTVCLFCMCLPYLAFGALNLELTKGTHAAIPVAVLPFVWSGQKSQPPKAIGAMIQHALSLSGRFRFVSTNHVPVPSSISQVDFKYWRNQGLNSLVIGRLQSQGDDQYQVTFSLINLFKNQAQITPQTSGQAAFNPQNNPVLATKTFTVKTKQLRKVAYQIADQVYQSLIGSPGFFSSKIAYVAVTQTQDEGNLYALMIANFDGTDPQTVLTSSQPIMSPSWSPDRKRLAYVSFQSGAAAIYTFNLSNGNRRLLASYAGINGAPAWSPDGKRLAIVLSKSNHANIYSLNLSTGRLKPLTKGWASNTKPAWSPDGTSLLFTSNRSGTPQIYQINLATKQVKAVTFRGVYNVDPAFSPTGQWMAFIHQQGKNYRLMLKNLRTHQLNTLVVAKGTTSPTFSPNGYLVLYAKLVNGQSQLALVSVDGRVRALLPAMKGDTVEPAWS